ncbi:hypothetical protein X767_11970 [Mesorhizobium sp. LSJC264A00]|nr:hypothetical protein X767_11970 [Mesorhizobium sp. LSJC264A00]
MVLADSLTGFAGGQPETSQGGDSRAASVARRILDEAQSDLDFRGIAGGMVVGLKADHLCGPPARVRLALQRLNPRLHGRDAVEDAATEFDIGKPVRQTLPPDQGALADM